MCRPSSYYRSQYGKYNGFYAWDLAIDWFSVSNDKFFKIYGFNFVPSGALFNEAKKFFHKSKQEV